MYIHIYNGVSIIPIRTHAYIYDCIHLCTYSPRCVENGLRPAFQCKDSASLLSGDSSVQPSPPGSFVHGILQAGILEWVAPAFSRGSFHQPRDWTYTSCGSCIGRRVLYHWAAWESLSYFKKPPKQRELLFNKEVACLDYQQFLPYHFLCVFHSLWLTFPSSCNVWVRLGGLDWDKREIPGRSPRDTSVLSLWGSVLACECSNVLQEKEDFLLFSLVPVNVLCWTQLYLCHSECFMHTYTKCLELVFTCLCEKFCFGGRTSSKGNWVPLLCVCIELLILIWFHTDRSVAGTEQGNSESS